MCGRYSVISKVKEIEKRFELLEQTEFEFKPNVNISAGESAPIILDKNPDFLSKAYFGFSPHWSKKRMYVLNARAEGDSNKENDPNYHGTKGIISKPMFRQPIRSQRCLVVADAYIEGPAVEKLSIPYVVYPSRRKEIFSMAGLWSEWEAPDAEPIITFAIITTAAVPITSAIGHHRAPLVLKKEYEKEWLDPDLPLQDVTSLLEPYDDQGWNAYRISPAIRSAKEKSPELLKPYGDPVRKDYDYEIYQEIELLGMGESPAKNRREKEEGQQELF